MFNKKKPSNLTVTNRIISYGGQTWAVRNITTVGKYEIKDSGKYELSQFLRPILIIVAGVYFSDILGGLSTIAILGAGLYLAFVFWRSFLKKSKFALKIVSSAGESELLTSKDERFIDRLVHEITYVIQSDQPSNLSINVDNRSIYDNLKNVMIGGKVSAGGDVKLGDVN